MREVGLAGSVYLAGAVLGAIFFGWLTDRLGPQEAVLRSRSPSISRRPRRPALSWNAWSFVAVPLSHRRRHRRRIHCHQFDNPGADPGAAPRLDRPRHQRQLLGRRGARRGRFARAARSGRHRSGDRLAAGVPDRRGARTRDSGHATLDSGKPALAGDARLRRRPRTRSSRGIEAQFAARTAACSRRATSGVRLRMRDHTPLREVARTLFVTYRQRTLVGLEPDGRAGVLLQCDLLHLCADPDRLLRHRRRDAVGWYILPFAAGNLLGPLLLGRLFDTIGRKIMIASTYALSGVLLAVTGYLFSQDLLTATDADRRLDDRLLLRLGGGELGLSDGERDLSRSRFARSPSPSSMRSAPASAASSGPLLFGVLIDTGSRGERRRRLSARRGPDDRRRRGRMAAGASRPSASRSKRWPAACLRRLNRDRRMSDVQHEPGQCSDLDMEH